MNLNPVGVRIQGSSNIVIKSRVVSQIFTYYGKWPLIEYGKWPLYYGRMATYSYGRWPQ